MDFSNKEEYTLNQPVLANNHQLLDIKVVSGGCVTTVSLQPHIFVAESQYKFRILSEHCQLYKGPNNV